MEPVDQIIATSNLVRLSKNDWKGIISVLFGTVAFLAAIIWFIISSLVSSKAAEIKQSVDRISVLESGQSVMHVELANTGKRQDEILAEIKGVSLKVGNISESVARIEGANAVRIAK